MWASLCSFGTLIVMPPVETFLSRMFPLQNCVTSDLCMVKCCASRNCAQDCRQGNGQHCNRIGILYSGIHKRILTLNVSLRFQRW